MANSAIMVTGGLRAPSALDFCERFLSDGHQIRIFASRNALRFLWAHCLRKPGALPLFLRHFRPQLRETFAYFAPAAIGVPHVAEGKWADVALVVPATCNSVGKLAAGLCDTYPLLVIRAIPRNKKVIVVPSMNPEMWFDPNFQRNIDLLNETEKYQVICPSGGQMASGDVGFGAQASFTDIVAETYRALGLDNTVEPLFQRSGARVPWHTEIREVRSVELPHVAIVDEDRDLRGQIVHLLERAYPGCVVHQFESPSTAMEWLKGNRASVVFTELAFADGATGFDLIEACRHSTSSSCSIIVTSTTSRRETGAERLARQDTQFLPKPLNVPFAVGMIVGSLRGVQHQPALQRRKLATGEFLFHEGEPGTLVYLLESGALKIAIIRDGQEITIRTVWPGETVGEMAFLDRSPRSASVIALEPSSLIAIELEQFREYLNRQPAWLRGVIETLLKRLRELTEQLASTTSESESRD
jgi:hypothetical protein